jgi:hypothetical protein
MSYAAEQVKSGRQPVVIVEMVMDYCARTYGVAPCTASVGVTGTQKCFNTIQNCQDEDNYSKTTKTYRFAQKNAALPPSFSAIPSLIGVEFSPGKLDTGGGLGIRSAVTLTFEDHAHHDRGIDPYVTERAYTPMDRGTFWGKFLARNQYYQGRPIYVYSGFIGATFDTTLASDFKKHVYVIEKIEGPDGSGRIKVTAKDPLKLADNERAAMPRASYGRLSAAIDDNDTTLTLTTTAADYSEYPTTGGYVRIDSEIIQYAGRTGSSLTGLTRAQYGTTAAAHDADAAVQLCYVVKPYDANGRLSADITNASNSLTLVPAGVGSETFADGSAKYPSTGGSVRIGTEVITYTSRTSDTLNGLGRGARNTTAVAHLAGAVVHSVGCYVPDVLYDLLVTYAGISSSYIPTDDWYENADVWLSQHKLDACISEPIGVKQLATELLTECISYCWWDEITQTVHLKAIAPPETAVETLTDDTHLVAGSVSVVDDPTRRASQVWVFFGKRDATQNDDARNFESMYVNADLDSEGANQYNERRIKVFKSRWFSSGNRGQAVTLGSRSIARLKETPRVIKFQTDAKDLFSVGDVVTIESRNIQDETGAAESLDWSPLGVHGRGVLLRRPVLFLRSQRSGGLFGGQR